MRNCSDGRHTGAAAMIIRVTATLGTSPCLAIAQSTESVRNLCFGSGGVDPGVV
jgi:hypothetical protein